jgi:hypothetical protein
MVMLMNKQEILKIRRELDELPTILQSNINKEQIIHDDEIANIDKYMLELHDERDKSIVAYENNKLILLDKIKNIELQIQEHAMAMNNILLVEHENRKKILHSIKKKDKQPMQTPQQNELNNIIEKINNMDALRKQVVEAYYNNEPLPDISHITKSTDKNEIINIITNYLQSLIQSKEKLEYSINNMILKSDDNNNNPQCKKLGYNDDNIPQCKKHGYKDEYANAKLIMQRLEKDKTELINKYNEPYKSEFECEVERLNEYRKNAKARLDIADWLFPMHLVALGI